MFLIALIKGNVYNTRCVAGEPATAWYFYVGRA